MRIKGGKDASAQQFEQIVKIGSVAFASRKRALLILLVLVILAFAFGAVAYHFAAQKQFFDRLYGSVLRGEGWGYFDFPFNYIKGKFSEPERIFIDIDYMGTQRLAYWRELAMETGTLYGVEQYFVDAQIRSGEETIPVGIRLRGGSAPIHFGGDKWSLRVRVKGENTLWGMKEFSLMDPQRRNFMLEWLHREVMKKEGIISKRYQFIEVVINGENKGIYALDEHYDKTMIEANQRREGPVIRISQEPLWMERAAFYLQGSERDDYYFSADIDAMDTGKIMSNPDALAQFLKASSLLEVFRNGDLPTSEVFDADISARWMAAGDILGAFHGFIVCNTKFYYNPITSKLEPIPDDAFTEDITDPGNQLFRLNDQYNKGQFLKQVFSDLSFTERYLQELERCSQKSYLDNILSELSGDIEKNMRILYRDYPTYDFPKEQLYLNQEAIREILNPYRATLAFFKEQRVGSIVLSIASAKTIPVEILNVTAKDVTNLEPVATGRTILEGKEYTGPLIYHDIEFRLPDTIQGIENPEELQLNCKLLGTSNLRHEPVFPWPAYDPGFLASDAIRQPPNFQDFDFIEVNTSSKEITVIPGDWTLTKDLIIPEGYTFVCNAGTNLDLTSSAKIISYSPIAFLGSEEHPVTVDSSDATGQGIVVLNAGMKSLLENAAFRNLAAPSQSGWELTGAVTFYESPVYISKSSFLGSRSEDALNIVRSEFRIEDSLFKDTTWDAFDSDFNKGSITGTSFINCGNDAIDFSLSVIGIADCYINGAGDKGVSAGENSQVNIENIEVKNGRIGVASKDMSEVNIKGIKIYDCEIGLTAYQKKPEFGPSAMSANAVEIINVATPHLIEEGSTLSLDNQVIAGDQKNLYEVLYGTQ